jgi:hypothetical protein
VPYAYTGEVLVLRHEQCVRVYELREEGLGAVRISKQVSGVSVATISRWLADPARFHPYIDEICVERALEGDRGAYDALTVWERPLFYDGLQKIRMSMRLRRWHEWLPVFAARLDMTSRELGALIYKRHGAGFAYRPTHYRAAPSGQSRRAVPRRRDRRGTTHRHLLG